MNLEELERKYEELGKEIEKLKNNDKFPVYKQYIETGLIVKFTGTFCGIVIRGSLSKKIGYESDSWINYKDRSLWKEPDVLIDKEKDLYHGQPVEYWDNDKKFTRNIGFYNVRTEGVFVDDTFYTYDNYKALVDIPEWMIEAQKTLKL